MKITADETLGAEDLRCLADRQKFGMGGRVLEFQRAVPGTRQDGAGAVRYHRTHGNLAPGGGRFGLGKGRAHWLWQFQSHRAT